MTQTLTLADFLLARIAEDETAASAAVDGPWRTGNGTVLADGSVPTIVGNIDTVADAAHIARHDPPRVLAEGEAKRQIVERLGLYASTSPLDSYTGHDASLVDVLRILALPYADHPDYRDEWRP